MDIKYVPVIALICLIVGGVLQHQWDVFLDNRKPQEEVTKEVCSPVDISIPVLE